MKTLELSQNALLDFQIRFWQGLGLKKKLVEAFGDQIQLSATKQPDDTLPFVILPGRGKRLPFEKIIPGLVYNPGQIYQSQNRDKILFGVTFSGISRQGKPEKALTIDEAIMMAGMFPDLFNGCTATKSIGENGIRVGLEKTSRGFRVVYLESVQGFNIPEVARRETILIPT
jgi:hypothetical protein